MGKPTRVVARSRCVIIDLLALPRISSHPPPTPVANYSEQLDTFSFFPRLIDSESRMLNCKDNAVFTTGDGPLNSG